MLRALITAILAFSFAGLVRAQPPAPPGGQRYACPMKCEGDKTYPAPGKCPVCGMNTKAVASPGYRLALAPAGGAPRGNEKTGYTLAIVDAAGKPVSVLDPLDGARLHLYIVLNDLASLAHLTPEPDSTGSARFETTLAPGQYTVYAAFKPAGGAEQIARTELAVSGKAANPRAMGTDADRPREADGCKVALDGYQSAAAGKRSTLTFRVTRNGKDATDLEPVLGKPANLVLISQDRQHLIRPILSAAQPVPGSVAFDADLPAPGLYRAWLEFRRAGTSSTVGFNFEVAPAK